MEGKNLNNNLEDENDKDKLIAELTTNLLRTKDIVSAIFIEKIELFLRKNRSNQSTDKIITKSSIEQIIDKAFVGIIMQLQQKIDNGDFYKKAKKNL